MTEQTALWDGTAVGDASIAPYDRTTFNPVFMTKLDSQDAGGFVVPGYLNNLDITGSDTSLTVSLNTGAALFKNYLYTLSESMGLPISTNTSGSARWDTLILRLHLDPADTVAFQTISADILTNSSTLTQTNTIWEIALAYIYIADAATEVGAANVHDRREFLITNKSLNLFTDSNLIRNSEFLANPTVDTNPPPHWDEPVAGSFTSTTVFDPMTRGKALRFLVGLSQDVYVNKTDKTYALKAQLNKQSGIETNTIILTGINTDGTTAFTKTVTVPITTATSPIGYLSPVVNLHVTTDSDNLDYITYSFNSSAFSTGCSQVILTPGYHTGPFRHFNEIIMFDYPVTDAAWTATAKSSSTTIIDLTVDFDGTIQLGTKAVILRMRGNDSGSLGGAPRMIIQPYAAPYTTINGELWLSGLANDVIRETQATMPITHSLFAAGSATPQFSISITATGAGLFDATVEIIGIIV